MPKFTRIEVHFSTSKGQRRAIVLPDSSVDAIFLNGSQRALVPNLPDKGRPDSKTIAVVPTDDVDEGPGVCYLVNGQLQCW